MLFSVGGCRTSASGKGSHRRRRVRIHAKHSYLRSLFFSFRLSTSFWLLLNGPGGVCCCCGCGAYQMFDFLFFEFFSFVSCLLMCELSQVCSCVLFLHFLQLHARWRAENFPPPRTHPPSFLPSSSSSSSFSRYVVVRRRTLRTRFISPELLLKISRETIWSIWKWTV